MSLQTSLEPVQALAARNVFKQRAFAYLCSEAVRYHDQLLAESTKSAWEPKSFKDAMCEPFRTPYCTSCEKHSELRFQDCPRTNSHGYYGKSNMGSKVILTACRTCEYQNCSLLCPRTGTLSCNHKVDDWFGDIDRTMEALYPQVCRKVTRNSRSVLGVISALAIGTQQLWKEGKVPRSLNEMLYQIAPNAYRGMVESILCIRSELSKPDNEDLKDAVAWDEGSCIVENPIPEAYREGERKVVIAIPAIRIHGEMVKGRAYMLNGDQLGTTTGSQQSSEPKDQLWLSFLQSLE